MISIYTAAFYHHDTKSAFNLTIRYRFIMAELGRLQTIGKIEENGLRKLGWS